MGRPKKNKGQQASGTANYARHVKTGRYIFFSDTTPGAVLEDPTQFVLYRVPLDHRIARARVVGEDGDMYCRRNSHVPKLCADCKGEARLRDHG